MDEGLLALLLANNTIKKQFFKDIQGVLVFDKVAFQSFVSNKQFLPDSYTAFKNKIGLTANNEYLTESKEVVLAWPYKDCVLEGGQTKEDQKRKEIFWNETLAPDEIDRLLAPKALTNFNKYDKEGEHKVDSISTDDNLIIKGNNLLALHSLKKQYAGKVKLIYIDPPYNTGSDSFNYNDSFNESTWLTFMRNRLEVAHKLLQKSGSIFIQIDHHQLGNINILLNEIFGKDNKVQIISIKTASPAGFKTVNPGPIDVTEYILFYTKNKADFKFKKGYVPVSYNKNYNLFLEKNEKLAKWSFTPIRKKVLKDAGFSTEKEAREKYGSLWTGIIKVLIEDFSYNNAENVVSIRDPHKPTKKLKELMEISKEKEQVIEYKREDDSIMYLFKGGALAFYSNKMRELDGKKEVTELLTDFWSHISWAGIAKEGGVRLKNGKKPEKLLKQILELATEENDIVLDYHLGSGTTCAVAQKMGRQFIGVEQLDYGKNDSVVRMQNVLKGEQSGVSKSVNWQGGGAFVYCELIQNNANIIDKIEQAKTTKSLIAIWHEIENSDFISYKIKPESINENIKDFEALSLDEQKQFLIEVLDKNQLYVNYSEIDDETYQVSENDKKLNKQFYGEA